MPPIFLHGPHLGENNLFSNFVLSSEEVLIGVSSTFSKTNTFLYTFSLSYSDEIIIGFSSTSDSSPSFSSILIAGLLFF